VSADINMKVRNHADDVDADC